MILAEKIAALRKKNGWSQEELAGKLNISRQSVSKWEAGASIPDLDKIILLGSLFGVSTDYLLKDELEEADMAPVGTKDVYDLPQVRSVSAEEADCFVKMTRKRAAWRALGVVLCMLSPVPLILLGGLSEYGNGRISENMAGGFGVVILLALVAIGVSVLVLCEMQMAGYKYLEEEKISLQYGVEGITARKKEAFAPVYRVCTISGVVLYILGVCPLMLGAAFEASDMALICCMAVMFGIFSLATFLCVWAGCIQGGFDKLLQEGEYTGQAKKEKWLSKKMSWFSGAYWCVVTAIFLIMQYRGRSIKELRFDKMGSTWLVWPVAGLLYAALWGMIKAVIQMRQKKDRE